MIREQIPFNSNDPYPLLTSGTHSYAEAQTHSEAVDAWLGIQTGPIEAELVRQGSHLPQELWIGLPIQTLLTPYTELRRFLEHLQPPLGSTVIDLGAGYG